MPLEEIKSRFNQIEALYKQQLEVIEKVDHPQVAYAEIYYFSLEEFYCEFNCFPKNKIKFHDKLEDVDSEDPFSVIIYNGKLLRAHQNTGKGSYFDSVFVHTEKESWHYRVFINAGNFEPISVEHLIRNDDGTPRQYIHYSKYLRTIYDYEWKNSEDLTCHIAVSSFSKKDEFVSTTNYIATYKNEKVDKIMSEYGSVAYNIAHFIFDLNQLIDDVKTLLIANVRTMMEEKGHLFKGKIAFALFEYIFEAAFPPALALATQEEAEAEEDPFMAYSAADLTYFSESDEYAFDLSCGVTEKFDILNKHISKTLKYEEAIQLVRSVYIDICKSPELYEIFKQYLDVTDDFHITVFDCQLYDLDEMLPLTVSEEVYQHIMNKKRAN